MKESERLIRLEEELAFQAQKLEGLNEALLGQQKQLDILENQLSRLSLRLESALAALQENAQGPADEKPPHYL